MAMIGGGAAVAEVGARHHELHGVRRLLGLARGARLADERRPPAGRRLRVVGLGLPRLEPRRARSSTTRTSRGSTGATRTTRYDGADEPERRAGAGRDVRQLEDGLRQASDWYLWGPVPERAAVGHGPRGLQRRRRGWDYFPHDHARSRAYRWGEDGLAGFSDIEQRLCLALALWNGRDPILKERIFGLTGTQGNHGEDAKEYWWYLDALPSHALEPVALPLPAGGRSPTTTWSPRTAGGASTTPSTSCSTPACSTTTATGSSRSTTPRPTRPTC